ncbi:MAG: Unknown protein [uncultured Sulfurovum sp.]|uniref:Uncharacterized protein n=1 Tax=uncultured Sulfurovum sp. TaxID=269237 RepID=A0A6S6TWS4_9BACT|nr:MAG: Unknown protein [uncultured Sulfurovum sp.]
MLCNQPNDNIEQEFNGLEKSQSIKKIFNFIEECLPQFKNRHSLLKPEDGLTQELVYILDNESREKLPLCGFSTEHMEDTTKGNSRRDDIGIRAIHGVTINTTYYPNNKPFIAIEAKRLDSKIVKKRKKEYVIGRYDDEKYIESGGIERFKKEIHGNGLVYVGMIGYLQTNSFDDWFEKINKYIDEEINSSSSNELVWEEKDKLTIDKRNEFFSTYNSEHQCKSKEISMYHIWINLIQK